jgi:hypothetical protein
MTLAQNQAFFLQLQQGLANRALAAAEMCRKVELSQCRSGGQRSEQNIPLQRIEGAGGFGRLCGGVPACLSGGKISHQSRSAEFRLHVLSLLILISIIKVKCLNDIREDTA